MPPTASTPLSSTVNLINNVIGAGLFSMPWCLAQSTIVSGLVVFVLICLLNVYSFVLLARCCTLTGCYSYLDIGRLALGPRCAGRYAHPWRAGRTRVAGVSNTR